MYASFYFKSSFWVALYKIDNEIAKKFHPLGCIHCGGVLHCANYPRKVRGIPKKWENLFGWRNSFCCSQCRRRSTPRSVRFLGRRVYGSLFVVLVSSLGRDGPWPFDLTKMPSSSFGYVTFKRWCHWWEKVIPLSSVWKELRGFLRANTVMKFLPSQLIDEFRLVQESAESAMRSLLDFISPLSEPLKYPPSRQGIV